jgi:Zn-dependent protease
MRPHPLRGARDGGGRDACYHAGFRGGRLPNLTPEALALGLTQYIVLLFSLSVHESAHGWTAMQMGDDTATRQGRVTLNPASHIDPFGTVLFPILQIFFGLTALGWAKPTPVGAHNFRKLARGHVLVAGAGPGSNLLLAALSTAALGAALRAGAAEGGPVVTLLFMGLVVNVSLAVFNLIPLPPLDGSWIASWGLPRELADKYDRVVEPYGQWILLILFFTGALRFIMAPFVGVIQAFFLRMAL